VRDDRELQEYADLVEELWRRFCPFADDNFRSHAQRDFAARYWEMHLASVLMQHGFQLEADAPAGGPDILTTLNGRRIWFEAVAVTDGQGPDAVPRDETAAARPVPDRQMSLRLLQAVNAKLLQFQQALARGDVRADDGYVVATNASQIELAVLEPPGLPRIAKVLYGQGDAYVSLDVSSGKVVGTGFHERWAIKKASGSSVGSAFFHQPDAAAVSAVLYSRSSLNRMPAPTDVAARISDMGWDFVLIHNFLAAVPLAAGALAVGTEWVVDGNNLSRRVHRDRPSTY
ncbi:MAG: hypothetical protein ABL879_20180, partial [Devosia sp.]